jgi:hypothetical protein
MPEESSSCFAQNARLWSGIEQTTRKQILQSSGYGSRLKAGVNGLVVSSLGSRGMITVFCAGLALPVILLLRQGRGTTAGLVVLSAARISHWLWTAVVDWLAGPANPLFAAEIDQTSRS